MELHNLVKSPDSTKRRKRIGRGNGSGHGTTACKGSKGQKARSGGKIRRGFEGGQMPLYRRIPKRGFLNINRKEYAIVNLVELDAKFKAGDEVTPQILKIRNIIKDFKDGLKILGEGSLTKAITVSAHCFSKDASRKIIEAGGTVKELK